MHKRPNLSIDALSGALAILGATAVVAACGGGETKPNTPVDANEVSPSGKTPDGANHCGAGKEHKQGEAACSADAGKAGEHSCGGHKPGDANCSAKK